MSSQTKKIRQDELRRLMNLEKKKLTNIVKKIDSPLARYDSDGNLTCIICQTVVRSEAVWSIHLNSKKHRENIANRAKKKDEKKKEEPVDPKPVPVLKRPAPPPPQPIPASPKKIKSILKNAPTAPVYSTPINSIENAPEVENDAVLLDNTNVKTQSSESSEEEEEEAIPKDTLPEGFFDDPRLDAKVRNVEYKDPVEEEWEQFQKEIREETSKAQQIIADEQEEATTERQIEEIDEQIRNWSRVINLEKKKQEVTALPASQLKSIKKEESSGEEDDFEEFLDWRSKKSFE